MPTLYYHEINAYKIESEQVQERYNEIIKKHGGMNKTHATFGVSNRMNYMVVGLCSLVEVFLLEKAKGYDLADSQGQGTSRLKTYLSKMKIIDFGTLKYWSNFTAITVLRNSIVHSYGGMIVDGDSSKLEEKLSSLGIAHILVGGRRIRVTTDALNLIIDRVDSLLDELGAYGEN